ncbi:MAG: alpha/beta fold hydrolase [Planctomycetales bacterium]|nr:alpha/beta fold hydrolase [Planctomycetales bacterium]
MSTFVLVHGASHGGWCWFSVKSLLEDFGHVVFCPDLPSHGIDRTPLEAVTLPAYANAIHKVLDHVRGPVILVGHSLGGAVISEVASQSPSRVEKLIYVSGLLLGPGQTVHEIVANDTEALLLSAFDINEDATVATPIPDVAANVFYHDCSAESIALATTLLVPHAIAPNAYPASPLPEGMPRAYVECTLDRTITLRTQREMHAAVGCDRVVTLESGHSPFFSMPTGLASHLHALSSKL